MIFLFPSCSHYPFNAQPPIDRCTQTDKMSQKSNHRSRTSAASNSSSRGRDKSQSLVSTQPQSQLAQLVEGDRHGSQPGRSSAAGGSSRSTSTTYETADGQTMTVKSKKKPSKDKGLSLLRKALTNFALNAGPAPSDDLVPHEGDQAGRSASGRRDSGGSHSGRRDSGRSHAGGSHSGRSDSGRSQPGGSHSGRSEFGSIQNGQRQIEPAFSGPPMYEIATRAKTLALNNLNESSRSSHRTPSMASSQGSERSGAQHGRLALPSNQDDHRSSRSSHRGFQASSSSTVRARSRSSERQLVLPGNNDSGSRSSHHNSASSRRAPSHARSVASSRATDAPRRSSRSSHAPSAQGSSRGSTRGDNMQMIPYHPPAQSARSTAYASSSSEDEERAATPHYSDSHRDYRPSPISYQSDADIASAASRAGTRKGNIYAQTMQNAFSTAASRPLTLPEEDTTSRAAEGHGGHQQRQIEYSGGGSNGEGTRGGASMHGEHSCRPLVLPWWTPSSFSSETAIAS